MNESINQKKSLSSQSSSSKDTLPTAPAMPIQYEKVYNQQINDCLLYFSAPTAVELMGWQTGAWKSSET